MTAAADRLCQLLAQTAHPGPWRYNATNHIVTDWEPDRVAFVDNEEDLRLVALAPELALLLADMADALAERCDTDGDCAELDLEQKCEPCALLARLDTLTEADG